MATVFVVIGSTGEYSDRREWFVAGYADQAKAEEHARLASDAAREIFTASEAVDDSWDYRDTAVNPYDTDASHMDYTGTHYYVAAVPMLDAVPAPAEVQ